MERYNGAPDDALPEGVSDEWLRSALAWIAGELDDEARTGFESALAADTPEARERRDWLDELRALHGLDAAATDAATDPTTTPADLLTPATDSGDLWTRLRASVEREQNREAEFTAAVRAAAGETEGTRVTAEADETVDAIFAAADEAPTPEPSRDLWPPLGRYVAEEPAVARLLRDLTADATDLPERLRDDLTALLAAANEADWHTPSRDLWPDLRARIAEADAVAADVHRATGEAPGDVADPRVAEVLDTAAAADWREPSHDLWPDLQARILAEEAFTADVSRAVGERSGEPSDPAVADFLTTVAEEPWREPSRDLWPGIHARIAGRREVAASGPRISGAVLAVIWGAGFAAAAALLALIIPVLLVAPDVDAPLANDDERQPGQLVPDPDGGETVDNGGSPDTPDEPAPPRLPSYYLPKYDEAVATAAADRMEGLPIGDQPTEILFCTLEARSFNQVRFDVPLNLSHRLLAADENFTDVFLPVSIGTGRSVESFVAFRAPGDDPDRLCFDLDGDGHTDKTIISGTTVDFALARPGSQLQPYPVRFDRDDRTDEWRATPRSAMVARAHVDDRVPVLVDGNLNGRYDDFGYDYLAFHGEERAVTLAPVVRIGHRLYEVEVNGSGTLATFGTYTGSTGLLLVDAHYRDGVTVDLVRLRTHAPDGRIDCELALTADDIGRFVTVPCSESGRNEWVLVNGRVTDGSRRSGSGGDGMVVEFGNCGPLQLSATDVLAPPDARQVPPTQVRVRVASHGPPGHLSLGGPLRLAVEMPEMQMHQPLLELSHENIALVGQAGERYRVFTMNVAATLLVKPNNSPWVPTGYTDTFDPLTEWPPRIRLEIPRSVRAPMALQLIESSVSVFLQGFETAITVAVF